MNRINNDNDVYYQEPKTPKYPFESYLNAFFIVFMLNIALGLWISFKKGTLLFLYFYLFVDLKNQRYEQFFKIDYHKKNNTAIEQSLDSFFKNKYTVILNDGTLLLSLDKKDGYDYSYLTLVFSAGLNNNLNKPYAINTLTHFFDYKIGTNKLLATALLPQATKISQDSIYYSFKIPLGLETDYLKALSFAFNPSTISTHELEQAKTAFINEYKQFLQYKFNILSVNGALNRQFGVFYSLKDLIDNKFDTQFYKRRVNVAAYDFPTNILKTVDVKLKEDSEAIGALTQQLEAINVKDLQTLIATHFNSKNTTVIYQNNYSKNALLSVVNNHLELYNGADFESNRRNLKVFYSETDFSTSLLREFKPVSFILESQKPYIIYSFPTGNQSSFFINPIGANAIDYLVSYLNQSDNLFTRELIGNDWAEKIDIHVDNQRISGNLIHFVFWPKIKPDQSLSQVKNKIDSIFYSFTYTNVNNFNEWIVQKDKDQLNVIFGLNGIELNKFFANFAAFGFNAPRIVGYIKGVSNNSNNKINFFKNIIRNTNRIETFGVDISSFINLDYKNLYPNFNYFNKDTQQQLTLLESILNKRIEEKRKQEEAIKNQERIADSDKIKQTQAENTQEESNQSQENKAEDSQLQNEGVRDNVIVIK